jgi:hypothetical protein
VESDKALFDSILTRLKETDVTKNINPEIVRVVQPAVVPEWPVSPRKKLVLAAAVAGGLGLGLVLAILRGALDRSLKTMDEAERRLGLPGVGAIPDSSQVDHGRSESALLRKPHAFLPKASVAPDGSFTAQYRQRPQNSSLHERHSGEGKTFCAPVMQFRSRNSANGPCSSTPDLRLPTVAKIFCSGETLPGLAHAIAQQEPLTELIQRTKVEEPQRAHRWSPSQNPAELLAGGGLRVCLRRGGGLFDRFVIDSAPVNAVSDTMLLVKSVSSVCLVVRAARTSRAMRCCAPRASCVKPAQISAVSC